MRRTRERATCEATSTLRRRERRPAPGVLSFRVTTRSGFEDCSAGASEKSIPVSTATKSPNAEHGHPASYPRYAERKAVGGRRESGFPPWAPAKVQGHSPGKKAAIPLLTIAAPAA